ncbi:MAG: hypothetical protein LC624_07445, partial [Halobacteriales archaeon]|nr:hypothetical protein [Halobacteriales archaeon]
TEQDALRKLLEPQPTRIVTTGTPVDIVQDALYTACGQLVSGPVVCSPVPVPFDTPVLLDITGDAVPDLLVLLAPVLLPDTPHVPPTADELLAIAQASAQDALDTAATPGLGVTLRISTIASLDQLLATLPCAASVVPDPQHLHLDASCFAHLVGDELTTNLLPTALLDGDQVIAPADLPARAWAAYHILTPTDDTNDIIRIGVDGTTSKIPEVTTMKFKVEDLAALLGGELLGRLNITFEQPGEDVTLFAEVSEVQDGQPVNPTTVSAHMTPVPDLGMDIDALLDGSHLTATLRASESPLLTVTYTDEQTTPTANTTKAEAIIDKLPTRVDVEYERLTDGAHLHYNANALIGTITASYAHDDPLTAIEGSAIIHELPQDVDLQLHTDKEGQGSIGYTASTVIPLVTGAFATLNHTSDVGNAGAFSVADIPAQFTVSWDSNGDPHTLVYDGNDGLGPASVDYATFLHGNPAGLAFQVGVQRLPPYVELRTADDFTEFDARSSASGAQASGTVEDLTLAFTTDGAFLGAQPPEDHVSLYQYVVPVSGVNTSFVRLDAQHPSLQYVKADMRSNETHIDVRNGGQHFMKYSVDVPGALATGYVDKVPDRVTMDVVGTVNTYRAFGQTIDDVVLDFSDKGQPPLLLHVEAKGVPDEVVLDADLPDKRIAYSASDVVPSITASGSVPTPDAGIFDLQVELLDIPTAWYADWNTSIFQETKFAFQVTDDDQQPTPLGSLRLEAHNFQGAGLQPSPLPFPPGCAFQDGQDHFCAALDAAQQHDAVVFELQDLTALTFEKGFDADGEDSMSVQVDSLDHQQFIVSVDARASDGKQALIYGTIDPLPTHVRLDTGKVIKYQAEEPFDLQLAAELGVPAGLQAMPAPVAFDHGIALHVDADGNVKVRGAVTGVGTLIQVDTDAGAFEMQGWAPTKPDLQLRIDIDPKPGSGSVAADITVHGVQPASGTRFLGGSFVHKDKVTVDKFEPDSTRFTLSTTPAIAGPVAVEADLALSDKTVGFTVSNIPSATGVPSADFTLQDNRFSDDDPLDTTIQYRSAGGVNLVHLDLGLGTFTGGFDLAQIPAAFTLDLTKNEAGPNVHYTATDPDNVVDPNQLDLDADITVTSASGDTDIEVHATDIGRTFEMNTVADEATTKTIIDERGDCSAHEEDDVPIDYFEFKSPDHDTGDVTVVIPASMGQPSFDGWGTQWCFDIDPLRFLFKVGFGATIEMDMVNLSIHVAGLGDRMTAKTGFISKIEGDYSAFDLDWGDSHGFVDITAGGGVEVCIVDTDYCISPFDAFSPLGGDHFSLDKVRFYGAKHSEGTWQVPVTISSPCILFIEVTWDIYLPISLDPPLSGSWDNEAHADGGTWYFLASPYNNANNVVIPEFLAQLIVWIGADDRGVDFSFPGLGAPGVEACLPFP